MIFLSTFFWYITFTYLQRSSHHKKKLSKGIKLKFYSTWIVIFFIFGAPPSSNWLSNMPSIGCYHGCPLLALLWSWMMKRIQCWFNYCCPFKAWVIGMLRNLHFFAFYAYYLLFEWSVHHKYPLHLYLQGITTMLKHQSLMLH